MAIKSLHFGISNVGAVGNIARYITSNCIFISCEILRALCVGRTAYHEYTVESIYCSNLFLSLFRRCGCCFNLSEVLPSSESHKQQQQQKNVPSQKQINIFDTVSMFKWITCGLRMERRWKWNNRIPASIATLWNWSLNIEAKASKRETIQRRIEYHLYRCIVCHAIEVTKQKTIDATHRLKIVVFDVLFCAFFSLSLSLCLPIDYFISSFASWSFACVVLLLPFSLSFCNFFKLYCFLAIYLRALR